MKVKKKDETAKSVISLTNLREIQNIISPVPTKAEIRKSIDLEIKKLSDARVANWKNTIKNASKLKLEKEKKEFIKNEAYRQKLDEEERKYQNMRYNLSLQKAHEYYFNSKDIVKSFNTSMFYSDILKEREKQIEINKTRRKQAEKEEEKWVLKDKEKMIEYDLKELEKKKLRKTKSEAEMNIIKQQFNNVKYKRLLELQDNYVEGELIKKQAQLDILRERKNKELIRLTKIKQNEEFVKLNEELKKEAEQRKLKELEEEKKIELEAKKKDELEDIKRRKEREKFNEKLKRQQKLIDIQFENLKRIKEEQERLVNKDVEIKMAKDENEYQLKIEKRNKLLKDIEEQRIATMKRKEEERKKERLSELNEIEQIRKKINEEKEKEKNEYLMRKQKVKDLHEYYKRQIEDKKKKAFNEFVNEKKDGMQKRDMINKEEEDFFKFAEEKIKSYHEQGKNIIPMLLELKKYKKNNSLQ
jgi:hypothetical protein